MLITAEYRDLNARLHSDRPDYGTTAPAYVAEVAELIRDLGARTILDYGCGKGRLADHISREFDVREYDPAIPGKDLDPDPADLVVCIDVLEHIEPECIDDVLDHLAAKVLKVGFFTVGLTPAKKSLADGRNAHVLLRSPAWWMAQINERFDILVYQAMKTTAKFIVVKPGYFDRANDSGE